MTAGTVVKLLIWSLLVGAALYWLRISPADIYGWIANQIERVWRWFAGSGLEYLLLGASIVIPLWLLGRLRQRMR